jgi:homopolymeric O-antigen transport system permease protein
MTASAETRPLSPGPARPVDDGRPRPLTRASDTASVWGLIWTLVRTDFKARYHGTPVGFLWALLKPSAMFLVLVAVFSLIFHNEPNYKLKLIIGLFLWNFFSEATTTGMGSLAAKGFLVSKARFPRWILVVTSIANALITLLVFAGVVTAYLIVAGRSPSVAALGAFAFYILCLATITIGLSLGTSVLFLRFRDLNQIWDMTTQVGFFLAPIVYPLGVIPERYHVYLYLWPPTPAIEFSRLAMVEGVLPSVMAHVCLALMAMGILAVGAVLFRRYGPRAAEYV